MVTANQRLVLQHQPSVLRAWSAAMKPADKVALVAAFATLAVMLFLSLLAFIAVGDAPSSRLSDFLVRRSLEIELLATGSAWVAANLLVYSWRATRATSRAIAVSARRSYAMATQWSPNTRHAAPLSTAFRRQMGA